LKPGARRVHAEGAVVRSALNQLAPANQTGFALWPTDMQSFFALFFQVSHDVRLAMDCIL